MEVLGDESQIAVAFALGPFAPQVIPGERESETTLSFGGRGKSCVARRAIVVGNGVEQRLQRCFCV